MFSEGTARNVSEQAHVVAPRQASDGVTRLARRGIRHARMLADIAGRDPQGSRVSRLIDRRRLGPTIIAGRRTDQAGRSMHGTHACRAAAF